MQLFSFIPWFIQNQKTWTVSLLLHDEKDLSQEVVIRTFPIIIGRASSCDLQLTDIRVSKVHCKLSIEEDRLVVTDLESRNGIALNGKCIFQKKLQPGDVLQVGQCFFEIKAIGQD